MKRYRLPSSCIRQPCLLPRSDAELPLTVPPAETEYHIVVYHITPSSAIANSTATTLYTVATMAINIMLYSSIQRLCVLTRAMGSCMINNCMAYAMKYISGQVLVIRSVKSLSSCISLKRDTNLLYLCKQQPRKKWLKYGRLLFLSTIVTIISLVVTFLGLSSHVPSSGRSRPSDFSWSPDKSLKSPR